VHIGDTSGWLAHGFHKKGRTPLQRGSPTPVRVRAADELFNF
jgi:hypothetical protein